MFNWIERIPYCRQWQVGLTVTLGTMIVGMTSGWTSPYIAKLTAPDCTHRLKLTPAEASWIASLRFVGRLIGTILAATIQGSIGRKKTLLCTCISEIIGWSLIIVAPTVPWLYASRILTGMTGGIMFTAAVPFLGEIADPMIRGSLITLTPNGAICGSLLGNIMGGSLPVEIYSYVCLVLVALFSVLFAFVPESPYYHIANDDVRKAEKSLRYYKKDVDVKREIDELRNMVESKGVNVAKIFNEFKKQEHRNSFYLIYLLTTFPYFAGMNTTESYAELILTSSKIDLTPSVVVMVLAFVGIVAGMIPVALVDKFGRKSLLMGSGLGIAVGHILLGSHFHMLSVGIQAESINWLPILSLFIVYFSTPCGLATVRESLVGELFPPTLKTSASLMFVTNTAIWSFLVSECFQPYNDLVGEKYVFWTFATFALCSVIHSYFFIPETTRMKLIDIQDNLKQKTKKNEVSTAEGEHIP